MAAARLPLERFFGRSASGGRPRFRPGPFQWVQLLVVLWLVASELLSSTTGAMIVPQVGQQGAGAPLPASPLVRAALAAAYALLAFFVSRRFPLWDRPRRHAAYYLGGLAGLHLVAYGCSLLLASRGLHPFHGWSFHLERTFEFVVYAVFAHGMLYGERYHEAEREDLRLRAEMSESTAERARAQVRALKMDWSPRFLTGTLDGIAALLPHDLAAARRLLVGLSSVLRRTLAHGRVDVVRLEKEVEFVREVLKVEALRRPGLGVEWEVDPEAWELRVPHMALLTMVADALGGFAAASPLRMRISAVPDHAALRLRVDAFGVPAGEPDAGGEDERLRAASGAGHDIRRSPIAPDGVRLELRIESEPREGETGGDAAHLPPSEGGRPRGAPPAPATPAPERRALGTRLEAGTYAAFLLFNTLLALHGAHARAAEGRVELVAPAWVYVAGSGLSAALWWGSLVAMAWFLSRRYPIRQRSWAPRLLLHAVVVVAVSVLNGLAYIFFQLYTVRAGSAYIGFRPYWEWGDFTVYVPLAGIAHGFIYARELHAKRISELRLRSLLSESEAHRTEAELQALKAELNPHFLFNALNTVASLMHTRPDEARRVAAHLSALLRRVLESGSLQEVSVEEEMEFIRLYMEIEQARFGDALRIVYRLDPDTLRARVPHLVVQPLVENAVKHGLRPRGGTGRVVLSTRRVGASLHVTVADDGVGLAHLPRADGTGTGLANVRERLRQLYGGEHSFELAPAPSGGATAHIRIPFSEEPRGGSAPAVRVA